MRDALNAFLLLALAATTLLAAIGVVLGASGLYSGRLPWPRRGGRGAATALALASALALSALVWAGWGGPFGGTGDLRAKPRADLRRADLGEASLQDQLERALPPSNRGARPRVALRPGRDGGVVVWLAADDAPDPAAMRARILDDAARVFAAVYLHPSQRDTARVRVIATHPSGQGGRPGAEPPVAVIELDRPGFRRLNPLRPGSRELPRVARVRWLPPLATGGRAAGTKPVPRTGP